MIESLLSTASVLTLPAASLTRAYTVFIPVSRSESVYPGVGVQAVHAVVVPSLKPDVSDSWYWDKPLRSSLAPRASVTEVLVTVAAPPLIDVEVTVGGTMSSTMVCDRTLLSLLTPSRTTTSMSFVPSPGVCNVYARLGE